MNVKISKYLTMLLFTSSYLCQGNPDSLRSLLNDAEGKDRIKILIELTEKIDKQDFDDALIYSDEALKLLQRYPDAKLKADVYYQKGKIYYNLNQKDSSKKYLEISEKLSAKSSYNRGTVKSLLLNARILRDEGLYEKSLEILEEAKGINEDDNNEELQIKILNEMGSVLRRLSRLEEAVENHKKALELLQKNFNKEDLSSTYTYLGISYNIIGDYDEALRYYHLALEENKKNSNKHGIAASYHNLGILYQKIGNYDLSLEYYKQAHDKWVELNDNNNRAATLNSMGAINELKTNYEEARKYYQQALEIWEKEGSRYSISIALNNLGSINEFLGNYNAAINYIREAIKIREELKDINGTGASLIVLASIYNRIGKGDSAIITAKRGLKFSLEAGSLSSIREAHFVLSAIYETNNYHKEALSEYKNYKAVHDSMFNSESQESIAEIQGKYKSEEQKKEIEILQKETEIQRLYRTVLIAGIILSLIILILLYNRYRLKQKAHAALEKLHLQEVESANLRTEAAETKTAILQVEFEAKKKELETARNLQLSMLPSKLPNNQKFSISASMITATEVGGDYYDFHCSKNGTLTVAIGDATGHGAQAGIMVTAAKSLFNLLADREITSILRESTFAIKKMNFSNLFMALAIIRVNDNQLELAGAGMPPAYILRKKEKKVEVVSLKGLPLGTISDYNYSKSILRLNKGDVVAIMSDGFPELFNNKKENFGYEKIPQLFHKAGEKTPDEIIEVFKEAAAEWLDGAKQHDDMTFVVIKVNE